MNDEMPSIDKNLLDWIRVFLYTAMTAFFLTAGCHMRDIAWALERIAENQ